ncbi:hypothetical protein DHW03_18025 [Pedobacter yonginense]|uniref:DUF3298 domain-containing protein n=1 Tax=Pedobacter yonginense TaxID=651869 RepID=A0A317EGJ9_9SPHI|nr:RsiV family protein [Pedobacter yonginense]PWS25951.1 hypothetical protein DHW03_18025 [Pedobacter yonginense]
MKKLILCSAIALVALTACNRSKTENSNTETLDSSKNTVADLPENFYKRLEGEIAGKHVVMNLQKTGSDYSGTYYYNGSWLNLSIDTLIGKDSVVLNENNYAEYYFDEHAKSNRLALKWVGNGFNGKWMNGKTDTTFPINLTEKYPAGSYSFSISTYQDSIKAFPQKAKSPVAEIGLKALTAPENAWLDQQLKKLMGFKDNQTNWNAGLKSMASSYLEDYKKNVAEYEKDGDTNVAFLNYSNHSNQSLVYNDKDFVIIEQMDDDYSGGAHGNYASTFHCLDVKTKKKLVLSDVVKVDTLILQGLLEKNLRKQYNVKAGEKLSTVLFDDYLKPNNNFYFNDNGLAFLYNPYEVASYAQGQIIVYIPFTELKPYLTPAFAARIGMK